MNQETPPQPGPPPSVGRNTKRLRLSDIGLHTETHLSEPVVPVSPPRPPPPRKPWPTRLAKDDVVALEQRIRYLDRLLDDAGENTVKARRRVEELRYGSGSLAKIHVSDSLRTSVTQEEYERARDEEISNEVHRDQHRKISGSGGGHRRVSEPPRLYKSPESKIDKMRRVSTMGIAGRDVRVGDHVSTRGNYVRDQFGKDNFSRGQATRDRYTSREQSAGADFPRRYSEKRDEDPRVREKSRAPEEVPDLRFKKTRDRVHLRVGREREDEEEYERYMKRSRAPK
ncbi:hypothetical protein TWF506_000869 [Arthrobotrys conoides]|uniref:Uncharacterized protein n=1 Tax=Arthrobotrys conoides TaxID=74498 RepID=A0AAN8RXC7_9PEZI